MAALAHSIKNTIENQFQVKVASLAINRQPDLGLYFSYTVTIEVVESKSTVDRHESNSIHALAEVNFNEALRDNGRLTSSSTHIDEHSNFRIILTFNTQDIELFANNLADIAYKAYSNQFDNLMTTTLSES